MQKQSKKLVDQLCELNKCTPEFLHVHIRRNYHKNFDFIKGLFTYM